MTPTENKPSNFLRQIIETDLENGKNGGQITTRFPPEPNGYLHIGHAKAICVNYGLAIDYKGKYNLRFDDTNPVTEETEYVHSIQADIKWLGFDWGDRLFYASDYFGKLFDCALELVKTGKAYVCELSSEQVREFRGTLTEPGKNSPFRDRSVDENLRLFQEMREGKHPEGSMMLRAKIDMGAPNINLRDPAMYRIRKVEHHRTGKEWPIYPMYDWAHGMCDAFEGITHSMCSLEFEDHRPLYDWFLNQFSWDITPRQIEFARLNINYLVMSKRKLIGLVRDNHVQGWDDPRLPTLAGFRRRGYTPESIRNFCDSVGVAKAYSVVDYGQLEHFIREDLNKNARRALAILKPLKLVLTNFPEEQVEWVEAKNFPENPDGGTRPLPFTKELYIDGDDFMEDPPKDFIRFCVGRELRLKYGFYVKCTGFKKDPNSGEILELEGTYDPNSRGGRTADKRKVSGTIQWLSASHCLKGTVRIYQHLFTVPNPWEAESDEDFVKIINPNSLTVIKEALFEPGLKEANPFESFQFERVGYFVTDLDSSPLNLIFNQTVGLKDSYNRPKK